MKTQKILSLLFLSSTLSLSGCWLAAGAVGAEAGYVATQENRTAGETISDQATLASVKTRLLADPDVSGLKINVDVFRGVVTLRGRVATEREIDHAIQLAGETSGVKSVDSRLKIEHKEH